jgi:hypothetical protein
LKRRLAPKRLEAEEGKPVGEGKLRDEEQGRGQSPDSRGRDSERTKKRRDQAQYAKPQRPEREKPLTQLGRERPWASET